MKNLFQKIKNNAGNIILGVVISYIVYAIVKIVKDDGTGKDGKKYYEEFASEADTLDISDKEGGN